MISHKAVWWRENINQRLNLHKTPLSWVSICEDFANNWPCFNSTTQYHLREVLFIVLPLWAGSQAAGRLGRWAGGWFQTLWNAYLWNHWMYFLCSKCLDVKLWNVIVICPFALYGLAEETKTCQIWFHWGPDFVEHIFLKQFDRLFSIQSFMELSSLVAMQHYGYLPHMDQNTPFWNR